MTDGDLLCAAKRGSAEAWKTLYQRYLPSVWRQACALVDDVHTAEDLTSETMLAFLEGIDRLESDAPKIAGWLRAVVRCKAADHHRRSYRTRDKLPLAADMLAAATPDPCPAVPLESEETRQQVAAVLDDLTDRQRTVLEWKYYDSLRVREIADRLGESEKAIETVLYRARREFRRLYELHGPNPNRSIIRREPDPVMGRDVPHES